eukprot:m.72311 g.72311  ORF g.72311 m.72311 type:complete len:260 (-) comp10104_c0_seq2:944-1723(-)
MAAEEEVTETQAFWDDDVTSPTPGAAATSSSGAMLIPVVTPGAGEIPGLVAFRVAPGSQVVVGRGTAAGVQVKNKHMSSKHCTIEARDSSAEHAEAGVWVTDTSANGTFLNGTRITKGTPTKLANSDVLALVNPVKGDVVSFVVHSSTAKTPAESVEEESSAKRRKVGGDAAHAAHAEAQASSAGAAAAVAASAGEAGAAKSAADDEAEAELLECCVCREILHGCSHRLAVLAQLLWSVSHSLAKQRKRRVSFMPRTVH